MKLRTITLLGDQYLLVSYNGRDRRIHAHSYCVVILPTGKMSPTWAYQNYTRWVVGKQIGEPWTLRNPKHAHDTIYLGRTFKEAWVTLNLLL